MFLSNCFLVLLLGLQPVISISDKPALHFELRRRGSRFVLHEPANLTALDEFIHHAEKRYTRTYRKAKDNRLVRHWLPEQEEDVMLNEAGLDGSWYIVMEVGEPAQSLEVTVDMLSPDWYHVMTSSGKGSKYDTFMSSSHNPGNKQVHALCHLSSDIFHLSSTKIRSTLDWPICQSSHSSLHTLHESGTILGLGPNNKDHRSSLSRIDAPSFLNQLHDKSLVSNTIWSITILDSTTGTLSLGGTIAKEMEEAKVRTDLELKYFDQRDIPSEQIESEVAGALNLLGSDPEEQFKWIDVHGSEGWWTGLITGIWVNGVKILQNQPFLLDLSIPLILAPPSAFQHLYTSIPGSRPPPSHNSTFHTYPCLNPPSISFELGGWIFPLINEATRQDSIFGPAGGEFSLGKVNDLQDWRGEMAMNESLVNSGYCVGGVVMSRVGERDGGGNGSGHGHGNGYRSGMKDVWVLGEMFFKGMGIVFDDGSRSEKEGGKGKARIGFRKY